MKPTLKEEITMTDIAQKLDELGIVLPDSVPPLFNYVPFVVTGNLVFIAGQVPIGGENEYKGQVCEAITIEQGKRAARRCAINILAQVRDAVDGDWSRVVRCVKLGGFVSCKPDFSDQSEVINGASDLIVDVMGDAGRHARFAVGAPSLPANFSVEVDAVFEIDV
ncbi:MAG: RidA family protein [Pseudomonadota bacterium]